MSDLRDASLESTFLWLKFWMSYEINLSRAAKKKLSAQPAPLRQFIDSRAAAFRSPSLGARATHHGGNISFTGE
jgi:hypothetical protein